MDSGTDALTKLRRKAIFPPVGIVAFLSIATWVVFFVYILGDYDLLSKPHQVDEIDSLREKMYLGLALLVTFGGGVGAFLIVRSQLYLISHGVPVVGQVISGGSIVYNGMRKVTVQYEWEGKQYKYAASTGAAARANVGEYVEMYLDPKRPKRVFVAW